MQNMGKTLKKCGLSLYSYEKIKSCQFSSTCISLHSHANPTVLPIHISCCEKLMKYDSGWMHARTHTHTHTQNQPCVCTWKCKYAHKKRGMGEKTTNKCNIS